MPGLRAGGRAAVPAPRPGAPSASLSTSPLLAPALPGHLPPPTPHSLLAGATAPTTRRQRRTGGRGARRRVWLSAAESECLPRLLLLLLRRLLPSSPRRRRCLVLRLSSSRRRHRRWCRRYRSTNYIRATRMLPPSENIGSFRRARPLPPSVFLPAQRSSRTAPSANLGLCRPSSSSEACFASSRPVSSFRLPLLFLTRASGHPYSCSGLAPLRDLLEAGPSGSGFADPALGKAGRLTRLRQGFPVGARSWACAPGPDETLSTLPAVSRAGASPRAPGGVLEAGEANIVSSVHLIQEAHASPASLSNPLSNPIPV
ncbi:uncharacterized protein LOC126074836 [Elephas maximus indicus]|uniref:uncharacterized protein LOC126074836 n=1 Tax=Elephas maximus indicus TaxID=99487 RepID=UPI002116A8CA|nr:uncharacterized protein LOC126074836 [Elephas maximus indicus]